MTHRCCHPECPGYPYRASEMGHPPSTCTDEGRRKARHATTTADKTADDLINDSASGNKTVTAPYTPDLALDLYSECDDDVDYDDLTREFWGTTEDGWPWRVHLTGRQDIVVGSVVEIFTADDERPDPDALDYYVAVTVTVAGVEHRVGVCVGARESDHGSLRASGAGVKPYCTAWWVDPSDHASLPAGWRDAVGHKLECVSWRLFREASEKASA